MEAKKTDLLKPTRLDYLEGRATHREFYAAIVKEAGILFHGEHDIVQRALQSTDEHYNNIPIKVWDGVAAGFSGAAATALRKHGDYPTLAGGVCIAKEAVRQAVERLTSEAHAKLEIGKTYIDGWGHRRTVSGLAKTDMIHGESVYWTNQGDWYTESGKKVLGAGLQHPFHAGAYDLKQEVS